MANVFMVEFDKQYDPTICAANEDSRPILTAVHLDPKGWLVASGGFFLSAIPAAFIEPPSGDEFPFDINIPPEIVAQARKTKHAKKAEIEIDLDAHTATAWIWKGSDMRLTGQLINGTFPKWRELIPEQKDIVTTNVITYNDNMLKSATIALGSKGNGLVVFPTSSDKVSDPIGLNRPLPVSTGPGIAFGLNSYTDNGRRPFVIIMPMFVDTDYLYQSAGTLRHDVDEAPLRLNKAGKAIDAEGNVIAKEKAIEPANR